MWGDGAYGLAHTKRLWEGRVAYRKSSSRRPRGMGHIRLGNLPEFEEVAGDHQLPHRSGGGCSRSGQGRCGLVGGVSVERDQGRGVRGGALAAAQYSGGRQDRPLRRHAAAAWGQGAGRSVPHGGRGGARCGHRDGKAPQHARHQRSERDGQARGGRGTRQRRSRAAAPALGANAGR